MSEYAMPCPLSNKVEELRIRIHKHFETQRFYVLDPEGWTEEDIDAYLPMLLEFKVLRFDSGNFVLAKKKG